MEEEEISKFCSICGELILVEGNLCTQCGNELV